MGFADFRSRMQAGERLVGTFVKTPRHEIVEVLSMTELDFICLDTEHSSFDRSELDACLAVARALDFPVLVRVIRNRPEYVLQALDAGAVGIVVPHIFDASEARDLARSARFGNGGRGFAASTRWAGLGRQNFSQTLQQSLDETVVIAQIEEPEGVDAVDEIAAVDGIDALFIGPADLSVAYGKTDLDSDDLKQAFERVSEAVRAHNKSLVTFVPNPAKAAAWKDRGIDVFFVGSETKWMADGATAAAREIKSI